MAALFPAMQSLALGESTPLFSWLSDAAWPWDRKESPPLSMQPAYLLSIFPRCSPYWQPPTFQCQMPLMVPTLTSLSQAKEVRSGL